MEPRKEEVLKKKSPRQPKDASKSRFQIVKLEERIAPRRSGGCYYGCPQHGHCGHGACK